VLLAMASCGFIVLGRHHHAAGYACGLCAPLQLCLHAADHLAAAVPVVPVLHCSMLCMQTAA
jgi:hypothetical protein